MHWRISTPPSWVFEPIIGGPIVTGSGGVEPIPADQLISADKKYVLYVVKWTPQSLEVTPAHFSEMNLPIFFHSHPPLPVSTTLQLLVSPVAGTGERGEHTHAPSGGSGASPTDVRRAELQLGKVPWILWRQVAHQLPHSSWDHGGTMRREDSPDSEKSIEKSSA